jgi:hypothetical protein
MTNADVFRKIADQCRQKSARAVSPLEAQQWQRASEEWLRLAQSGERGGGSTSWLVDQDAALLTHFSENQLT